MTTDPSEERYVRQVLLFGKEGQRRLCETRVGIVGLGGLGSHLAQGLSYLGVRDFVLVDEDVVAENNLNRLVGASPEDIGKTKVDSAWRMIRGIQPSATVDPIAKSLFTRQALDALTGRTVIFGAVDNDAGRLVLTELCAAYEVILIDSASEISEDGTEYGGRVVVARPGDFCLDCAREIDMERAKQELLSEAAREVRRAHGYGLGELAPAASVVSINGVVAHLAITEFLVMITGLREPARHVVYRAERPKAARREDGRRPNCYVCGYLVAKRDAANVWRYSDDGRARV